MDRDQFPATARELLERHVAEQEPTRPEDRGARYAQGVGDYVTETTAALKNDAMINREYHEHERNVQKDLEQHIEQSAPGPQQDLQKDTDRANDRSEARKQLERYENGNPPEAERTTVRAEFDRYMNTAEATGAARTTADAARDELQKHITDAERGQAPEQTPNLQRKTDVDRGNF
jgi:hypothetical protein